MFKKGDRVISSDYGEGEVHRISLNDVKKWDSIEGKAKIIQKGVMEIKFDDEDQDPDNPVRTVSYTLDGKFAPDGSGYHGLDGVFRPYNPQFEIKKI